jgi:carbon storage regulator
MLVLSRKANQSIMIGDDIRIMIVAVDRDQVRIGIEAPRDVPVHRFEVFEEIRRGDEVAVTAGKQRGVGNAAGEADISGDAVRDRTGAGSSRDS